MNQGSGLNGNVLLTLDGQTNAPCGFVITDNIIGFCLSGSVPLDQFVGLNVVMSNGSSFEISSCVVGDSVGCDISGGTFYDCTVSETPSDVFCVSSIESDGTLITQCNNTGGCN